MFKSLVMDAIAHFRECILINVSLLVAVAAGVAYLKITGKNAAVKIKMLLAYAIIAAALVLIPVTNAVIRIVTGTYYDAPDMWTAVPLIPIGAVMIAALAGEIASILTGSSQKADVKSGKSKHGKGKSGKPVNGSGVAVKAAVGSILIAVVILVCGSLGTPREQTSGRPENAGEFEKQLVITIYEKKLLGGGEQIVLAPDDIMAYIHTYSGTACTLYGRDMWDGTLTKNRYGYYDAELISIHDDMVRIMNGETNLAVDVCRRAFEQGATVVVMPGYCDYATIHHAGYNCVQFGGVTPESLYVPGDSGYGYILVSNGDFMHQTQSDNWYVNQ
jgi:hypothetical protein